MLNALLILEILVCGLDTFALPFPMEPYVRDEWRQLFAHSLVVSTSVWRDPKTIRSVAASFDITIMSILAACRIDIS